MNTGSKESEAYFLCWTEKSTTVLRVQNDERLSKDLNEEVKSIYLTETPIMPRKKTETSKLLAERVLIFTKQNVQLLCELPSCKAIPCRHESKTSEVYRYHIDEANVPSVPVTFIHVEGILTSVKEAVDHIHIIIREEATDVFVF